MSSLQIRERVTENAPIISGFIVNLQLNWWSHINLLINCRYLPIMGLNIYLFMKFITTNWNVFRLYKWWNKFNSRGFRDDIHGNVTLENRNRKTNIMIKKMFYFSGKISSECISWFLEFSYRMLMPILRWLIK